MSNYINVKNFRKSVKVVAIRAMGEVCQICKYGRCQQALELHHIDPNEKEISFNQIHSWDVLYAELKKAILLCANCHREVHYNDLELPKHYAKFDKTIADNLRNAYSHNAVRAKFDKHERIQIILKSNIDFSKNGWGSKLRKVLKINSANATKWVKRNMQDFYKTKCFKPYNYVV